LRDAAECEGDVGKFELVEEVVVFGACTVNPRILE
jgi:hypothetical protein